MSLKFCLQVIVLVLVVNSKCVAGSEEDVKCLQSIKDSVEDPLGYLNSWTLSDPTLDHCRIFGVECLHNEVYSLTLANSSLSGSFPQGLGLCKSLTQIDLSNNQFSGPISPTLCTDVPFLVILNLANNRFTGPVPDNLATCYLLNDLYLQANDLCGPIPENINNKTLPRLTKFEYYDNNLDANCSSDGRPGSSNVVKNGIGMIVGVVIGALGVAGLIALGLGMFWWFRPFGKTRPSYQSEADWFKRIRAPNSIMVSMFDPDKSLLKLKLSDLIACTDNFSAVNVISSGKSGAVYKGTCKGGILMAIKRLAVTDHSNKEFRAEMETLGKLNHRNLVPLFGYCIAGKERLLVYKYMSGGSLQDSLRRGDLNGSQVKKVTSTPSSPQTDGAADVETGLPNAVALAADVVLDWTTRLRIAIGTARGLAWLHHSCNPRVLHRNISSGNILIDEGFEPRISNFGLARLMNPVDTHISTFIDGDFGEVGYVPPEYSRTLMASVKGDVFSFGVVLLELVTGQKPTDVRDPKFKGNLASWVWMLYTSGKVGSSIDPVLIDGERDDELLQFLMLAVACVHPTPKERPTMYEVFHMLRAIGAKYHLTDENDEIPLVSTQADLEKVDIIVSTDKFAD